MLKTHNSQGSRNVLLILRSKYTDDVEFRVKAYEELVDERGYDKSLIGEWLDNI